MRISTILIFFICSATTDKLVKIDFFDKWTIPARLCMAKCANLSIFEVLRVFYSGNNGGTWCPIGSLKSFYSEINGSRDAP